MKGDWKVEPPNWIWETENYDWEVSCYGKKFTATGFLKGQPNTFFSLGVYSTVEKAQKACENRAEWLAPTKIEITSEI